MSDPRDDDLRAMLEGRAARLPTGADREIIAAVREEMRAPTGGAGFAVLPVAAGGRGTGVSAGWVGIGLVAVLVLAVLGGRLDTRPVVPAATGTPAGRSSPTAASSVPGTSRPPLVSLPRAIDVERLRLGLVDGSLDGQVVLLTASLTVSQVPCLGTGGGCPVIQVSGLPGVAVRYWQPAASAADVWTTVLSHPVPALLAFRVEASDLVLLGWPEGTPATPLTVPALGGSLPEVTGDDLVIVSGWLAGGRSSTASCPEAVPSPAASALPCEPGLPMLNAAKPLSDGRSTSAAVAVTVDAALGLGPAPAVMQGPFLVRRAASRGGDMPPFEVIGRLDQASAVSVGPGRGA